MKNNSDRKFEIQVNHLQSFIGMPMWNGRNPSLNEIREYDRRIIEQQAKDFKPKRKNFMTRIFSWLYKSLVTTYPDKVTTVVRKKDKKDQNRVISECCMQANT